MKNEEDVVESLYKDNFHDPELPVSKDLWLRISGTIERKRRRRVLGIVLFSGILLGTALYIVWPSKPAVDQTASVAKLNGITNQPTLSGKEETTVAADQNRQNKEIAVRTGNPVRNEPFAGQQASVAKLHISVTETSGSVADQQISVPDQHVAVPDQKVLLADQKVSDDSIALHKDSAAAPAMPATHLLGDNAPPAPVLSSKAYLTAQVGGLFPAMSMSNPALGNNVAGSKIQNTGFSAMVNAGIAFKNNWNVSIGICISHFQGSFSSSGTAVSNGNDSVALYSKDVLHTYLGKRDSVFTNVKNYTASTHFNAELITVPVSAAYRIPLNERWGLDPFLGLGLNYLFSGRASYNDQATNELITENNASFKTFSVSAMGGVMVEYQITEKWRICLAPSYSYFVGNLYKDSDALKIAPSGVTISAGFRYFIK